MCVIATLRFTHINGNSLRTPHPLGDDFGQYLPLLHEIWLVAFWKIVKIVATRCQILWLKCTKFDFGWGSDPDLTGGAYSAPPDP